MINAILNGILKAIMSLLSVFLTPLNLLITNAFPDFSSAVTNATTSINSIFSNITWAIGFLPSTFKQCLSLIFLLEIAYWSIKLGAEGVIKIFGIIQKIKFW